MPLGLTPDAMAAHADAWADLAGRALEPTIFNDPAFLLPAALHLPGRPPRFVTAWDPADRTRLIGVCCLAPPGAVPLHRAWLPPEATTAVPLLDSARPAAALAGLLARIKGPLRPQGLLLQGLPQDGATMRMIAADPAWSVTQIEMRGRAVLRGTPPLVSGKAGKEFRRQARRLADQGCVTETVAETPDALDAFLALEAQGWKGRRATALLSHPGRHRFARAMLTALLAAGRCRIHTLALDGRPIAMGVVLRSGPTAFFWKTAFDEALARFSPGAHLAAAIGAAQAREPGVTLTDSCAVPDHSMIDRLWPDRMHVVDAFVAPCRPAWPPPAPALGLERMKRALRERAKRLAGRIAPGRSRHNPNMAPP